MLWSCLKIIKKHIYKHGEEDQSLKHDWLRESEDPQLQNKLKSCETEISNIRLKVHRISKIQENQIPNKESIFKFNLRILDKGSQLKSKSLLKSCDVERKKIEGNRKKIITWAGEVDLFN